MDSKMKISKDLIKKGKKYYDSDSDVLWIIIKRGEVERVEELLPGTNVEFDRDGSLIGIEVLNYAKQKQSIDYSLLAKKVKDSSRELESIPEEERYPIISASSSSAYFVNL